MTTDTDREIARRILEDRNISVLEAAATYSTLIHEGLVSPALYQSLQRINNEAEIFFELIDRIGESDAG